MMLRLWPVCLLSCIISLTSAKSGKDRPKNDESIGITGATVFSELLLDYDAAIRPSFRGPACQVLVSFDPLNAHWSDHRLQLTLVLHQQWLDERLKFLGETAMRVTIDQQHVKPLIWLPDTIICDSLDIRYLGPHLLMVKPSGEVTLIQRVAVSLPCSLTAEDVWRRNGKVQCQLALMSQMYSVSELQYSWTNSTVNSKQDLLQNLDFTFIEAENKTSETSSSRLESTFQIQTGMTKDVLNYLIKKASKDL